jgi:hypothetical protein
MSYIGGPLPEVEDKDERELGKRDPLNIKGGAQWVGEQYQKLPEDVRANVQEAGSMLGTAWEGAKRIDNKYDPFEYVASGTAHTIEGIGKVYGAIVDPVKEEFSKTTGLDPIYGDVAEFALDLFIPGSLSAMKKSKVGTKVISQATTLKEAEFLLKARQAATPPGSPKVSLTNVIAEEGLQMFVSTSPTARKLANIEELRAHEAWVQVQRKTTSKQGLPSLESTPPMSLRKGEGRIAFENPEFKKPGMHQHHEVQKKFSSAITNQMRKLVKDPNNIANEEDLYNLFKVPSEYGLEAGSGQGALKDMFDRAHVVHHGEARRKPTFEKEGYLGFADEPSGALDITTFLREIQNTKDPKKLIELYREFLEDSLKLNKQADLLQRAQESYPLAATLGPEDISKQDLVARSKEIGERIEGIEDVKIEEAVERAHRGGLSVKKTNPTQFPERIQKHIQRSKEIGITEPTWKNGKIDYTWRPETNTGQIDIPEQTNFNKKGFKGLKDDFYSQIEELPSGSVWELNPNPKKPRLRPIYARLFKGDPRIVPNPDPSLGWILTIP